MQEPNHTDNMRAVVTGHIKYIRGNRLIFECLNFFTSTEEESLEDQALVYSEILSNAFFGETQAVDVDEYHNITEVNDDQRLSRSQRPKSNTKVVYPADVNGAHRCNMLKLQQRGRTMTPEDLRWTAAGIFLGLRCTDT